MNRTVIVIVLVVLGLGVLLLALRPDSTSPEDDNPTETSADEPQERIYDVAIEGGTMNPGEISVEDGDFMTLRFTSESPVEVHETEAQLGTLLVQPR